MTDYKYRRTDEQIYIDLRPAYRYTNEIEQPNRNESKMTVTTETKKALSKKMRLRVWGYTNDEYRYMLLHGGVTLKYKTYTIKSEEDELESKKDLY